MLVFAELGLVATGPGLDNGGNSPGRGHVLACFSLATGPNAALCAIITERPARESACGGPSLALTGGSSCCGGPHGSSERLVRPHSRNALVGMSMDSGLGRDSAFAPSGGGRCRPSGPVRARFACAF